ncbi:hypothetical protein IAT38_006924 [Cryptococcus sp. DSM 104549]
MSASPRRRDSAGETSSAAQHPRKKRKPRPQLSCTECRRLKLKCDRVVPCASCIRRQCTDICRLVEHSGADDMPNNVPELQQRVLQLEAQIKEGALARPEEPQPPAPQPPVPARSPSGSTPRTVWLDSRPSPRNDHPSVANHPSAPLFHLPTPPRLDPMPAYSYPSVDPPGPSPSTSSSTHQAYDARASHPPLTGDRVYGGSYDDGSSRGMRNENGFGGRSGNEHDEEEHSYGTLVISKSGKSKYLGRTAGSEWLKNQETLDAPESPPPQSRVPSPSPAPSGLGVHHVAGKIPNPFDVQVAFPFTTASRSLSTASLLSVLPLKRDGKALMDCYYRHFSWHADIAPYEQVQPIFDLIYDQVKRLPHVSGKDVPPQELALLYSVFAMGAYYNLELPPDDPSIEEYLSMAKMCLAKGDFLSNNTMSGLQTLIIVTYCLLCLDCGKNGDSAWPMWGLTARMIQAMGLHRDGSKWNLPEEECERRRRVFWESHVVEVMTSNNFSRPGCLPLQYIDTAFPKYEPNGVDELDMFKREKYSFARIVGGVVDHNARVIAPSYSSCLEIHEQIVAFERNLPYRLQCRPVLCALPSVYPDPNAAIQASPPIDKRDLQLTFQQFTFAMNISEVMVFLHRPYYARALHSSVDDPTRSVYGQSYLTVVERCNEIIIVATNLYELYPQAAARHWWIWHHAFSAAVCMGTLILKNPKNVLAPLALSLLDQVVTTYTNVVQGRDSVNMARNLTWLIQLRREAHVRLEEQAQNHHDTGDSTSTERNMEEGDDHADLLGWRTRLINRAGQGRQAAKMTIGGNGSGRTHSNPGSVGSAPAEPQPVFPMPSSFADIESLLAGATGTSDTSWEAQMSQFWDPVTLQEGSALNTDDGLLNWWGFGGDAGGPSMQGGGQPGQGL